jgi:hypothetical protein
MDQHYHPHKILGLSYQTSGHLDATQNFKAPKSLDHLTLNTQRNWVNKRLSHVAFGIVFAKSKRSRRAAASKSIIIIQGDSSGCPVQPTDSSPPSAGPPTQARQIQGLSPTRRPCPLAAARAVPPPGSALICCLVRRNLTLSISRIFLLAA